MIDKQCAICTNTNRLEARLQQHITAQHAATRVQHSALTQTNPLPPTHDVGVQCCEVPSPEPGLMDEEEEVDHLLCVLHQAS